MKTTTIHNQAYEFYSWQELGDSTFTLAQKILDSGQRFDRIIALAKGGLTFARSMVDFLSVDDVSTIKIEFYTGIGTTARTPVITQSLPVSIKNENILIFDDIVDKGDTMQLAIDYLRHHGVQSITTAVLISKPWARFTADFSASSSEAWVIFPNEIRETIETLVKLWQEKGDSPQDITKQLREVGFGESEVALFTHLE